MKPISTTRKRKRSISKWPPWPGMITGAAMIVIVAVMIVQSFARNDALRREEQQAMAEWDSSWPPLPNAVSGLARPLAVVEAAYVFAGRHGDDVLQYIPCYCGCEREGHVSNRDCYIRGRTGAGVPQWDPHATMCGICLDVARDAKRMYEQGMKVAAIRTAIEQQYAPKYGAGTPTSRPPVDR